MPASVFHAYTNNVPNGTATSVVRPVDWNSSHLVSLAPSGAEMVGGFSNANGVTFSTNTAGRIEASIVTNYIPMGNSTQFASASHTHDYAASNHSHAFSASGGSSAFQTLNFANSNGITFSNINVTTDMIATLTKR